MHGVISFITLHFQAMQLRDFVIFKTNNYHFSEQNKPASLYNEHAVHFPKGKSEMFFVQ